MRPACISTWHEPTKYFGEFLATSAKHGIKVHNADDSKWEGATWKEIPWWKKSAAQARFVRDNFNKYSHFIFVDAYDVCFAAGLDEIVIKYEAIGAPIVFGAECYPWPDQAQAPLYPETPHRCKYLNAGFWMGSGPPLLDFITELETSAAKGERCDQGIAVDMFLSKRHPMAIDTKCSICFCCNMNSHEFLDVSGDRPKTTDTGEQPCLFHGNGASPLPKLK